MFGVKRCKLALPKYSVEVKRFKLAVPNPTLAVRKWIFEVPSATISSGIEKFTLFSIRL
jgi:hypothetical protein